MAGLDPLCFVADETQIMQGPHSEQLPRLAELEETARTTAPVEPAKPTATTEPAEPEMAVEGAEEPMTVRPSKRRRRNQPNQRHDLPTLEKEALIQAMLVQYKAVIPVSSDPEFAKRSARRQLTASRFLGEDVARHVAFVHYMATHRWGTAQALARETGLRCVVTGEYQSQRWALQAFAFLRQPVPERPFGNYLLPVYLLISDTPRVTKEFLTNLPGLPGYVSRYCGEETATLRDASLDISL